VRAVAVEFPEMVVFDNLAVPPAIRSPAPLEKLLRTERLLPVRVDVEMVNIPVLCIPAPVSATFPATVINVKTTVPELRMPPPVVAFPFRMAKSVKNPFPSGLMLKTRLALFPETVKRRVPDPRMVIGLVKLNSPSVKVMVWAESKSGDANTIVSVAVV